MYPDDPQQLRDIHDALGHPWWPLAPGWWLLLAVLVAAGMLAWSLRGRWRLHLSIPLLTLGDWRWDAAGALRRLREKVAGRTLTAAALKARVSELSELLRRIAMARHGRSACAGRQGEDWLDWLAANDPRGFDWRRQGRLLLDAPYAPEAADPGDQRAALLRLIDAAQPWISRRPTHPQAARRWSWPLPWRSGRHQRPAGATAPTRQSGEAR